MRDLQLLLRNRARIGPKLINRPHLVVVEQRVDHQTAAARPEQHEMLSGMHRELCEARV